ncbi:hypothetical protein FA419_02340 [Pseudomonas aeruginosa]|nr:hypothetical protein [Pseudomonas aeruginosa]
MTPTASSADISPKWRITALRLFDVRHGQREVPIARRAHDANGVIRRCGEVTVLTHAKRGMDRLEPL